MMIGAGPEAEAAIETKTARCGEEDGDAKYTGEETEMGCGWCAAASQKTGPGGCAKKNKNICSALPAMLPCPFLLGPDARAVGHGQISQ